jgi:methylthioribulose-1-phosphate dehydratase
MSFKPVDDERAIHNVLPPNYEKAASEIIAVGQWIASHDWCPATGGNFSQRISAQHILMTASGRDKGHLSAADLLLINLQGDGMDVLLNDQASNVKPSAEMPLHVALYELDHDMGVVLHTHSIAATVISRVTLGEAVIFQGYEMQKSLRGVSSHVDAVRIRVVDNDQNMLGLAQRVKHLWMAEPLQWGLLVRGHGLYVWGRDMAEARRHLAGIEFLLASELELRRCR